MFISFVKDIVQVGLVGKKAAARIRTCNMFVSNSKSIICQKRCSLHFVFFFIQSRKFQRKKSSNNISENQIDKMDFYEIIFTLHSKHNASQLVQLAFVIYYLNSNNWLEIIKKSQRNQLILCILNPNAQKRRRHTLNLFIYFDRKYV